MTNETSADIVFAVLVNIANILGILYNIPQIVHTYRRKTAGDISALFLKNSKISSILLINHKV